MPFIISRDDFFIKLILHLMYITNSARNLLWIKWKLRMQPSIELIDEVNDPFF